MIPQSLSKPVQTAALGVLLFCSGGCRAVYGLKKPLSQPGAAAITRSHHSMSIKGSPVHIVQVTYAEMVLAGSNRRPQQSRHIQPLQLLCYNRAGRLVSWKANCDAGGFPNIKWARFITGFPPADGRFADSSFFNRDGMLAHIRTAAGEPVKADTSRDYTVVLLWSHYMGRQTRNFVKHVQQLMQAGGAGRMQYIAASLDLCNDRFFNQQPQ